MRNRFSLIIICLLLWATVATAFHHHGDAADHGDCPVCTAGQHQQAVAGSVVLPALVRAVTAGSWFVPPEAPHALSPYTPANNRAPPA